MVREGECVGGGTRKEGRRKEERGERVGKEQSVSWCLDKGRKEGREGGSKSGWINAGGTGRMEL